MDFFLLLQAAPTGGAYRDEHPTVQRAVPKGRKRSAQEESTFNGASEADGVTHVQVQELQRQVMELREQLAKRRHLDAKLAGPKKRGHSEN